MKFSGTLIAVKDMEKSKKFYRDILGRNVADDFGANVRLEGDIYLQTIDTWKDFIKKDNITPGSNAFELYFEEDDFERFARDLQKQSIKYVHPVLEHSWGQRAVRFYDPDGHIIEVAENLVQVVKRFIDKGLSIEETAIRMDVSIDYIKNIL